MKAVGREQARQTHLRNYRAILNNVSECITHIHTYVHTYIRTYMHTYIQYVHT